MKKLNKNKFSYIGEEVVRILLPNVSDNKDMTNFIADSLVPYITDTIMSYLSLHHDKPFMDKDNDKIDFTHLKDTVKTTYKEEDLESDSNITKPLIFAGGLVTSIKEEDDEKDEELEMNDTMIGNIESTMDENDADVLDVIHLEFALFAYEYSDIIPVSAVRNLEENILGIIQNPEYE